MSLLIKNGRVVDPSQDLDAVCDVLVEQGKIARIEKNIKGAVKTAIDAAGMVVMPGLVDMHVHLREPGREDKETVATGTLSAIKGGVTSMAAMPNTFPALDTAEMVKRLDEIIRRTAHARVYITGAITIGRLGRQRTDFLQLKKAGIVAVSDDGNSVDDAELMHDALLEAEKNNLAVLCHCEDRKLSAGGVVNQGIISTRMGLRGISSESESSRIERDILLAEKAGCAVHIQHVSCKESVRIIAEAKKRGVPVTAETAPHYFALHDEAVLRYDTNKKMNPPLRSKEDVAAIVQGLRDGTLDAIASDHAPHTENEKDIEFDRAEFGVIGLETELAVSITELIEGKILSWKELVAKVSCNPARILGIDAGTLAKGSAADIVIADPQGSWTVARQDFCSKSKNSAFLDKRLTGIVRYTVLQGAVVYAHASEA